MIKKLESVLFYAYSTVTRNIRENSNGKLYQELSLEFLQNRSWRR